MLKPILLLALVLQSCSTPGAGETSSMENERTSVSNTTPSPDDERVAAAGAQSGPDTGGGDDDEFASPAIFRKFQGNYAVTVDRFFLDTKDRGIIGVEFQEKYTFKLLRPDSITIETSLVSGLGSDAAYYPKLTLLGGAYAQGPDTLHIYLEHTKLNGQQTSDKEAGLDLQPPFILYHSKGKIFMETDYIHLTRYPRERYELIRQ